MRAAVRVQDAAGDGYATHRAAAEALRHHWFVRNWVFIIVCAVLVLGAAWSILRTLDNADRNARDCVDRIVLGLDCRP